jgi:hypothetical protein
MEGGVRKACLRLRPAGYVRVNPITDRRSAMERDRNDDGGRDEGKSGLHKGVEEGVDNPQAILTGGQVAPDLTDDDLTMDDLTDLQTGRRMTEEAADTASAPE